MSTAATVFDNYKMQTVAGKAPEKRDHGVKPGEFVLWYPDAAWGSAPRVAAVQQCGDQTLALMLLNPEQFGHVIQGARHMDDESLKEASPESKKHGGGWDYTDQHKRFLKLESRVEELHGLLRNLSDELGAETK